MSSHNHSPGFATGESTKRQRLEYLKRKLTSIRQDLSQSPDLRALVTWWLGRAEDIPAGTTRELLGSRLAEIERGNQMYNGSDQFPEDCEGCPHYGIACPVLTDNAEIQRREQMLDTIDDPDALKMQLRTYALDNHCHVLEDVMDSLDQDYGPLLRDGQTLLFLAQEYLYYPNDNARVMEAMSSTEAVPEDVRNRIEKQYDGSFDSLIGTLKASDQAEADLSMDDVGMDDGDEDEAAAAGGGD